MKTKEELNALKEEIEALNKKLAELTEDELAQVSGGGEHEYGIIAFDFVSHSCGEYASNFIFENTSKNEFK